MFRKSPLSTVLAFVDGDEEGRRTTRLTRGNRNERDFEISPGSVRPRPSSQFPLPNSNNNNNPSSSSSIAPWEDSRDMDFSNYRKELGVLDTGGSKKIPSINRQPPSAISPIPSNWPPNNGQVPKLSSAFGSFYNDSDENLSQFGQRSPGFRPGSSQTEDMGFPGDDRRPSVASATTVSSTGSRSSIGRGFHKKLQGFF
ncbi:hypothetical protein LTS18_005798, partial [Coniosporium uncinatum]